MSYFMFGIYYSVDEVAELRGFHPESIRRLIRQKKLPAVQIGDERKYLVRQADATNLTKKKMGRPKVQS